MAIAQIQDFWMPTNVATVPTIGGGISLDIANVYEKVAMVFVASKTTFVQGVFFKLQSVATGCTLRVSIENVDTATGEPNGIPISGTPGKESYTNQTVSSAGNYFAYFPVDSEDGLTFELLQGTLCAVVFSVASGTPSNIHFATFTDDNAAWGLPYCIDYDGATASQTANYRDNLAPIAGIIGELPIKNFWPLNTVAIDTFQATSTPDTLGNRFTTAVPTRISGVRAWLDADSTGTIKLYGSNGSTVLASTNVYAAVPPVPGNAAHIVEYYFPTSVDLAVGNYYIAMEATGTTIGLATMTFPSSIYGPLIGSSPLGGKSMIFASCTQTPTSAASWTLDGSKQAFLTPIFSGYEIGGAAGGGETSHVFAV